MSRAEALPLSLRGWLAQHAEALDRDDSAADAVLPELARAGVLRIGVPVEAGGSGGEVSDAVEAIAALAEHSVTAAFVCWAQRSFIEYLVASPNAALRGRLLEPLLGGRLAGASGLSNAMKFLAGVEALQLHESATPDGAQIDGRMPWVTNLRRSGYVVAAAVSRGAEPAAIVALPGSRAGMRRTADLELLALRGSNTAAITVEAVALHADDILAADGPAFLARVRPAFLGLQCGLSIGLARIALEAAAGHCRGPHPVLQQRLDAADRELTRTTAALYEGLADGRFVAHAAALFELRIRLAALVQEGLQLELQASGGRAYLLQPASGFGRRWREAAFIPVVTPSVTQLQGELLRQAEARHALPAARTGSQRTLEARRPVATAAAATPNTARAGLGVSR